MWGYNRIDARLEKPDESRSVLDRSTRARMNIRQATEADLGRLLDCHVGAPISWANKAAYLKNLEARSYRLEWTWIAEENEHIIARAVWWGIPTGQHPMELDCLYAASTAADPIGVCARLVRLVIDSAPQDSPQPTYQLLLPSEWRCSERVQAAVSWRLKAVANAGLTQTVERLRFEWKPDVSLPVRSSRLTFVEEPNDERWIDVFRRVAVGSLDSATRREESRTGGDVAARNLLATYRSPPGRRDWWRLALNGQGELIGFAMPAKNERGHTVGYLGVLPRHRGQGYANDLLAEITHRLVRDGAKRIVGDADTDNVPMVEAFRRLQYRNFAVRIVAG